MEAWLSGILPASWGQVGWLALPLAWLAGVLTSLSPCTLSMLPVVVGYLGGYGQAGRAAAVGNSLAMVLGLAVTFSILGLVAAAVGGIFGRLGAGWHYAMAAVAIVMGLQLLGILHLRLPGLTSLPVRAAGPLGAFLVGLFFGLVASPCTTPVLAGLVAWVANTGRPAAGAALLFAYGLGHGVPLFLAGSFTAALKGLLSFRRFGEYVNAAAGVLLLGVGLYLLGGQLF